MAIERRIMTPGAERLAWRRLKVHGDSDARRRLVEHHIGLAMSIAGHVRGDHVGLPREDMLALACMLLVKAVDLFEPSRCFAFSTFASPYIFRRLGHAVRDASPLGGHV